MLFTQSFLDFKPTSFFLSFYVDREMQYIILLPDKWKQMLKK